MSGQYPGMSLPQPKQQSGLNDMRLLQQHLLYKQLQELRRQQQLQQLTQEARQQNSANQLSAFAKQAVHDQLRALPNGMPIYEATNYLWQNELMGGDSKIPSSNQMFTVGNMNWAQRSGYSAVPGLPNGLMFSYDQGQTLRSIGLVPQHPDQSLHGIPVSSTRDFLNQYSQIQGSSHDGADMMTKTGGNPGEKLSMQSSVFSSFQNDQFVFPEQGELQNDLSTAKHGISGVGQYPVLNVNSRIISEDFQKENTLARSMEVQKFHGVQGHADWSGNLQEKSEAHAGSSHGLVSLDPTEHKILFSKENEANWDASFARSSNISSGGYLHGSSLGGNDYFNAFPSVQSGSWSALMQSAVAEASGSDTGLQDEWSGLSFQKTEVSSGNHDSQKQQTAWVDNNLQTASSLTSRPFPQFSDSNINSNCPNTPNVQQSSIESPYEQSDRVQTDASHDILHQSSKEVNKQFGQNLQQKQFFDGFIQVPVHFENASCNVLAVQLSEQPASTTNSADVELNSQNMQGFWDIQPNMASYNIGSQPNNKMGGWNINEALPSSGNAIFRGHDSENTMQHPQTTNLNKTSRMDRNHGFSLWKADENRVATLFPNSNGGLDSVKLGNNDCQVERGDSYMGNIAAIVDSNTSIANEEMYRQSLSRGHVDYGKHAAVDSSLNCKGSDRVAKFQFSSNSASQSLGLSMNSSDRVSGRTFDIQTENSPHKEVTSGSHISFLSHPGWLTGAGDQTRENSLPSRNDNRPLSSSNQKPSDKITQKPSVAHKFQYQPLGNLEVHAETTDSPIHISHSETVSHGLKSQEQGCFGQSQFDGNAVSNKTMDVEKRRPLASQRNTKGIEETHSGGTICSYDSSVSTSLDELGAFSVQNRMDSQTSQNMLELLHKVDQSRGNTIASGHVALDRANVSFESQADLGASEHSSHLRQTHKSHDGAIAEQYSQPLLHGEPGMISPFRLTSLSNTCVPVVTPSYSIDALQSAFYLRSLNQQLCVPKTRPVPQPSVKSGMSQQGGFSAMLHNAWTNVSAQQDLSSGLSHKAIPNLIKTVGTSSLDTTSWAPEKLDDDKKGLRAPSDFGACAVNSQQFTYGEEQQGRDGSSQQILPEKVDHAQSDGTFQVQELMEKHSSDANSTVSISSLVHLHQQDLSRGKHGQGSSPYQQGCHTPLPNNASSNCDIGVYARTCKPSDVHHQNYSLLQQMQAMKSVEMDPSKRVEKRLKRVDFSADSQQMAGKPPQKILYQCNSVGKVSSDNRLSDAAHHISFPSNTKILSFSMGGNKDQSASTCSQLVSREVVSLDIANSERIDPHSQSRSLSSVGRIEHAHISRQMAPSWFEQYGNTKNGQILAMYNGFGSSETAKPASQHYFFPNVSKTMDTRIMVEQKIDTSQAGSAWKNSSNAPAANEHSSSIHYIPSDFSPHNLVMGSQKRKSTMSELLPRHSETTQTSRSLQRASMGERDWAQASNRLIEKVRDEVEMNEDGLSMPRPRRRLILTTHLMQQLLPSIPAAILRADATTEFGSVTYCTSKLALGDVCSLISFSGSSSHGHTDKGNTVCQHFTTFERIENQVFTKVMEDFLGRAEKMESIFSRLEKRASVLDIRVECQDLERFSIINRFGKFHGRCHTPDGVESSTTSDTVPRKILPQRYVTAFSMPGNLPEGGLCLSL